ncbi:hypothetical protein [Amycolatopsis sp. NPDC003676]
MRGKAGVLLGAIAVSLAVTATTAEATGTRAAFAFCPHGSFCIRDDSGYPGRELSFSGCDFHELPNGFTRSGSWVNNQADHRTTSFYGNGGKLLYTTPPAYSADPHADWHAVRFLRNNC